MCSQNQFFEEINRRVVLKFRGLTLLLRFGTLWKCGDGLFFEVPPFASDAVLTTLHPLLEDLVHTVCFRKIVEQAVLTS
jgi:hypothetical protein